MFNPQFESAVRAEVARVGNQIGLTTGADYNALYRAIAGRAPA